MKRADQPMVLSLVKTITAILFITALVILYVLASTLTQHAKTQLEYDLNLVGSVIQQFVAREEASLSNAANVLAQDFGFRSAVATNDEATIESVLINHSERVNADLALLMDLDGRFIASNASSSLSASQFAYTDLLQASVINQKTSAFIVFEQKLYLVILIPVKAPTPVAYTLFGFEFDEVFLSGISATTGLQVRLDANAHKAGVLSFSTSGEETRCLKPSDLTFYSTLVFADSSACIDGQFVLVEQPHIRIEISVYDKLQNLFSDFYKLQISILFTILFALALSLLLTVFSARKITAPLGLLVKKTRVASQGDYSKITFTDAVTREVGELGRSFNEMVDAIEVRETAIRYQADHDTLSQSFNRRKIEELFHDRVALDAEFSVVAINIVGLRTINDTFGFHLGDTVIAQLANNIMSLGGDVARLDGGSFLWLCETKLGNERLEVVQNQLQQELMVDDTKVPVTLSMAHLRCPSDACDFEALVHRVNIVLDEARSTSMPLLLFHESFEARYNRKLQIVAELKKTLQHPDNEFKMVYQPKYCNAKQQVTGAEALIRWINPALGFVPPDEFIEIAEQAGIIGGITAWVLRRVASDCAAFREAGVTIAIAINLSTRDLNNEQLFGDIMALHQEFQLPLGALSFEVTESDLVTNPVLARANLNKLRDASLDVAIDDFGTGYSSLSYLKTLPINILKIDKSFVLKLATDEDDQSIVKTTLLLAESLGLRTVAEGVEDKASLALLSEWGCTWCQGYFISKPADMAVFITWFKENENISFT